MSSKITPWIGLIGAIVTIPLVQTSAAALSAVEVERIANQLTIKITSSCVVFGSGVIIRKDGTTYTVLTVAHNFKKSGCQFTVTTADNTKYPIANIKKFPNAVDLAVFTFTSTKEYPVAKLIANSDTIGSGENIYVSGFPLSTSINTSIFSFVIGDVISNSSTKQQANGYSLIYSNDTLPGHSGGPVWNDRAEVIAIHGRGDVDNEAANKFSEVVDVKTGFNQAITVNTFTKLANSAGIGGYAPVTAAVIPKSPVDDLVASALANDKKGDYRGTLADMDRAIALAPQQASLYFIRGIAKSRLGDNQGALADLDRLTQLKPNNARAYYIRGVLKIAKLNDTPGALADFNLAIDLKPDYVDAYYDRAILKESKSNDFQGALADYDRAIQIDPSFAKRYYRRGNLKFVKLNDSQGALTDYDRAIQIDSSFAKAYYSRALLKIRKLNDSQGALTDYSRAIQLKPDYADAYYNRAILKIVKLKDRPGAIEDMNQAAKIFQQQGNTQNYQKAIDSLKKMQQIDGNRSL
jgi:tetratricopeptide (TPR) repeat protein